MPIYEYKCQQCGAHYEVRQKVSDPPLTTCEKCHGKLEKQWSLSGFQFKGGGWYVTDYAGNKNTPAKSEKSSEKSEKSSTGDSTASTDGASNTKDDPKPAKSNETAGKSD
jgi:putative FmdB family regulatory protein